MVQESDLHATEAGGMTYITVGPNAGRSKAVG